MKKILEYPFRAFNNKNVLRTVIHSVWIMFVLLLLAYEVDNYDKKLFEEYELQYTILKQIFNAYLSVCIIGYYLSKNKVCLFTLISFYAIIVIRITSLSLYYFGIENTTPYIICINRFFLALICINLIKTKLVPLTKNVLLNKNTKNDIIDTN